MRLHSSAVAFKGLGVLILGASGSGKSALALHLMALGADLVADDQTELDLVNGTIWMRAPDRIAGLIEARGVGILKAKPTVAPLYLVVDLDVTETSRLPDKHVKEFLGQTVPCLHKVDSDAWPFAILQYLKDGRSDPE